jgi:hypothetical protein
MFFAEANWASGHEAASKGRTHDRIRAATESSYLALESRAVPHMTHVLTLPWLFSPTGAPPPEYAAGRPLQVVELVTEGGVDLIERLYASLWGAR